MTNFVNQYKTAQPFPHLVIDNILPDNLLEEINSEFSLAAEKDWIRYNSPDEQGKRIFNKQASYYMPHITEMIGWLIGPTGAALASALTGIPDLQGDPDLYGGSLHVTEPNGRLGLHLDNEIHPKTGFLRRLNLIIFCTKEWQPEWGGELEFWDITQSTCVTKVAPIWNRLVLFECSNRSFHGHTAPWTAPVERRSLAVHYWSKPRARALFVAKQGEQVDRATLLQREQRSKRETQEAM